MHCNFEIHMWILKSKITSIRAYKSTLKCLFSKRPLIMGDLLKRTLYNLMWWYMTFNYYFIHCNGFYYIVLVFRIFTTPFFLSTLLPTKRTQTTRLEMMGPSKRHLLYSQNIKIYLLVLSTRTFCLSYVYICL